MVRRMRPLRHWAPLSLTLLLAACSLSMPTFKGIDGLMFRGQGTEVLEVSRALDCGSEQPETRIHRFASAEAYRSWAAARGLVLPQTDDLTPARYALIELGQRPSGGYGLAVSRQADRRGDILRLRATFIEPGPDAMVTQALTAPCALVRLPVGEEAREEARIELYDQAGNLRAVTPDEDAR